MHNLVFDATPFLTIAERERAEEEVRVKSILVNPFRNPLRWLATKLHYTSGWQPTAASEETIVGPIEMAAHIQRIKGMAVRGQSPESWRRTHYFVWARGESPDRRHTRMGGAPYLPAAHPWPCDADGRPKTFLAQINMMDSHELFAQPLPGDFLLVFVGKDYPPAVVWTRLGDEPLIDVAKAAEIQKGSYHRTMAPLTGHLCEVTECSGHVEAAQLDRLSPELLEQARECDDCIANGTRIGGRPVWQQDEPSDCAEFIACVAPVYLRRGPWPLLNVERPIPHAGYERLFPDEGSLWDIGSDSTIYIYRDKKGEIVVTTQGT